MRSFGSFLASATETVPEFAWIFLSVHRKVATWVKIIVSCFYIFNPGKKDARSAPPRFNQFLEFGRLLEGKYES
jgi:hypothetical protein